MIRGIWADSLTFHHHEKGDLSGLGRENKLPAEQTMRFIAPRVLGAKRLVVGLDLIN